MEDPAEAIRRLGNTTSAKDRRNTRSEIRSKHQRRLREVPKLLNTRIRRAQLTGPRECGSRRRRKFLNNKLLSYMASMGLGWH